MINNEYQYIVFPNEAEGYVEGLKILDYGSYGQESWYRQHSYLEKLNMQAVVSAKSGGDEFIKEFLISHQKIPILVNKLISTELWKKNVFKHVLKRMPNDLPTFPVYVVIYHELVLVNLLETVSYHVDAVESHCENAIDLCDWCHRALCRLVIIASDNDKKVQLHTLKDQTVSESNTDELKRQAKIVSFEISMKAICLSGHLIQHCCSGLDSTSTLPLEVSRRLLKTHDYLMILCQLIELNPWSVETISPNGYLKGRFQWHESGVWISEANEQNWTPITKSEGQVWISIYQIVFSNILQSTNYDINIRHRREALLRLRPHLTETRIDVIPVLGNLRIFLEQFSISNSAPLPGYHVGCGESSSSVAAVAQMCQIELVAKIHDTIILRNKGKWQDLADEFLVKIQSADGKEAAKRAASKWADTFSEENVDAIFGSTQLNEANPNPFEHPLLPPPRCVVCGEIATKRCSRCRQEWYCRRECQVKHWFRHKTACNLLLSPTNN